MYIEWKQEKKKFFSLPVHAILKTHIIYLACSALCCFLGPLNSTPHSGQRCYRSVTVTKMADIKQQWKLIMQK